MNTVTVEIKIESSNAVFQADDVEIREQIIWSLEETVQKLRDGVRRTTILDMNGNPIGKMIFKIEVEN